MVEDRIHHPLITVNHIEDAVGQAGFFQQFRQQQRCGRVAFAGLENERFPVARAIGSIHNGTMAGKLKGVMPATTPSGWRKDQLSMPVPTCSVNSPLSKWGYRWQIRRLPDRASLLRGRRRVPCRARR